MNILSSANSRFGEALTMLEQLGQGEQIDPLIHAPPDYGTFSTKLYSLLNSWLEQGVARFFRDRRMVNRRDRFSVWRLLLRQYLPRTRGRALALMQAIHSFTN